MLNYYLPLTLLKSNKSGSFSKTVLVCHSHSVVLMHVNATIFAKPELMCVLTINRSLAPISTASRKAFSNLWCLKEIKHTFDTTKIIQPCQYTSFSHGTECF